jgi:hypothetical protein
MSDIPTPRSYNQIVGQMVDALLSRLGLKNLYVGSAALSIIEAAAQSDLRSSQDIFEFLNSQSLDRATGTALTRIGADEGLEQLAPTAAAGRIGVTDTSFSKISSVIFQGLAAPIVGTTTLAVENAASFPASGSVYLGRNTLNYEGPLTYTSKTNLGTYWTLSLSTPTTKFHNLAETVILAQGGDRTIPAGTVVSTAEGAVSIEASTTFEAIVPDGENQLQNIPVVVNTPGSIGNLPANAITRFVNTPFANSVPFNTRPFGGGRDTETVEQFRERIRQTRASRSKGTVLAIKRGVIGATAIDENRSILSAALVLNEGEPAALYVDDGTGYQEKTTGIAFETLTESAVGGERYFSLTNRAITKAFVTTEATAPFDLRDLSDLTVRVGQTETTHRFNDDDFVSINGASAYEVVASINKNPAIAFSARVEDDLKVAVFARTDNNEDIQIVQSTANEALRFSTELANTLWLYKDDQLLSKDGLYADLPTRPQPEWGSISSGASLLLEVDSIPLSITVTDLDFINNSTGFTDVNASNSLAAWVTVLNAKIPGVNVSSRNGGLVFRSNKGLSAAANIRVTGGTLASSLFVQVYAEGRNKDYSFDRNLGQIKLEIPLLANERLTAASFATRSFVQTAEFTTKTVTAEATSVSGQTGAELWAFVDGSSETIPTGVGAGASIQVIQQAVESWGRRVRYQSPTSLSLFENVRVGDWLFALDSSFTLNNRGAWRVVRVPTAAPFSWLEIERATGSFTAETVTLTYGGLYVARSSSYPYRIYVDSALSPYTPSSLAAALASQFGTEATASVYRTRRVRVRTNSFDGGDFAFVAGNQQGQSLGFPIGGGLVSGTSHLGSVISQSQHAIPTLYPFRGGAGTGTSLPFTSIAAVDAALEPGKSVVIEEPLAISTAFTDANRRFSNAGFDSAIETRSAGVATLRQPNISSTWLADGRFYQTTNFELSPRDSLGIVVDNDQASKRFVVNTYRRLRPTTATYGATNSFTDTDNSGLSLARAFGTSFNWQDFAIHMKSRVVANGILWRYYRHGHEGNYSRLAYAYPSLPNSAVSVRSTLAESSTNYRIYVSLESGAPRTTTLRSTTRVGTALLSANQRVDVLSLVVASGSRIIRLDYSGGSGLRTVSVTGVTSGATATVVLDFGTYVQLTGVTGNFLSGEALTFGGGGIALAVSSQYGFTQLTLTLPATVPAVTNHGFAVNNIVWLQSTDPNFVTGPKYLTAVTATTISYRDTAVITGAIAGSLSISFDAGEATLAGAGYVVGDIWNRSIPYKTRTVSDRFLTYNTLESSPTSTTLTWAGAAGAALYPLGTNSTATIAAAVNATANTPVTGTVVTPGNIVWASYEPEGLGFVTQFYSLVDGINFVRSNTTPPTVNDNFSFTFKEPVSAGLATGSDWINEEVRIVPVTTKNVVDYLSVLGTSGLSSTAEVVQTKDRVQITTATIGSGGSVSVEGGLANLATASVVGSAVSIPNPATTYVNVNSSEAEGLTGRQFVWVENTTTAPKNILNDTSIVSISGTGALTVSTKAWQYPDNSGSGFLAAGTNVKVEKHGDLVAYIFDTATVNDKLISGDWFVAGVEKVDPTIGLTIGAPGNTLNPLNRGIFRVVAAYDQPLWGNGVVWVENPNAVEETATASFIFLDDNSLLPGDSLVIGTSILDPNNLGTWIVDRIDRTNEQIVFLKTDARAISPVTSVTLGSSAGLVQTYGKDPVRLLCRIGSISPAGNLASIRFTNIRIETGVITRNTYQSFGWDHYLNSNYGTIIRAASKLGFETNISRGRDGYKRYTGIISEANKIVYGFEPQSSSYPGIAAAGAKININGPLIRQIALAIAIRPQTGAVLTVLVDETRAAISQYIQSLGVGEQVSIGEIIAAAQSVDGVVSAAIISPNYSPSSDLIAVQPYEKALILNNDDIVVNFVGE